MSAQSPLGTKAGESCRDGLATATTRAIDRFTTDEITRLELVDELLRIDRLDHSMCWSSAGVRARRTGRTGSER